MRGTHPTLLVAACDAYLAGAFARRFEREGWDVVLVERVKDAVDVAVQMRPQIFVFEAACTPDPALEVRRLRALPTMQKTRIVVLTERMPMSGVNAALDAGASDVLLVGHVVPVEAVARMKKLIAA